MADATRDFELAYRAGTPPWDIGRPQPEVVRLAAEGELVGDVLDVGCGTGENALHLASLGHRVLGVDASPSAIERARAKAAARGLPVPFAVADALALGALRRRFETALDCGLFHVFAPDQRRAYVQSLCEVLAPGSTLHLLCFSDEEPPRGPQERTAASPRGRISPPGPGPYRIAQHEIGDAFRGIFAIVRIRAGLFESLAHPGGAKAWVTTLVRI
jgi:SAM-dependent methyltransferase